ncbi:hypothetical protein ABZZ36_31525 [Actinacidiphila glaucinigra]|uniref:hypothetical protein n=1 Tax=Actinacidiphila glaucinigra TaxID=235986 RepID=UPI0033BBD729
MSPKHSRPRKAELFYSPLAHSQLEKIDTVEQASAIERARGALEARPDIGELRPDGLRDYRDEDSGVRMIYFLTIRNTIIVVAYLEVD